MVFGLKVVYKEEILDGFKLVSQWLDLDSKIEKSGLIIRGEGHFDQKSLQGKGPGWPVLSN